MNRLAVVVTLAILLAGLGVAIALTIPWTVLAGASPHVDVARDFTSAEVSREVAYHSAVRPPVFASLILGLVLSGVLALTPLGARLVSAVARPVGGGFVAKVVLGTLALTLIGRVATLPLDVLAERVQRRYGLSTQTWGSWLLDRAKGIGVGTVMTSLVLLAVLWLVRPVCARSRCCCRGLRSCTGEVPRRRVSRG